MSKLNKFAFLVLFVGVPAIASGIFLYWLVDTVMGLLGGVIVLGLGLHVCLGGSGREDK